MLSERLRLIRKKRGLTQTQLADKVQTTKGTISNYENGHSTPSNEMLCNLADALDTTTDYILGRTHNHETVSIPYDLEFQDEELQNALKEAFNLSKEYQKQAIDFIHYLSTKAKE
ncbi:helix-turn-helix domain-containing protein [Bacillus inaquosorum]|uniref:helix-turn-helix domain-containing protein n=1 Tax=Bacillus subtilis group TaxID=653685 RepID=UPI00227F492B|nr:MULTISPECIES: helix-turn-helix transcriptional regulator [Bacillus subtilis group]MCY9311679.1 helix-turn-helix domain-containing protein [Bacillus inaquosorum]WJE41200.1 helix-turn-helix transcriptional regulator [Bacillus halotolerans]